MKTKAFDKINECEKFKLSRQKAMKIFFAGALVTTIGCALPEEPCVKFYFDGPTLEYATYDAKTNLYKLAATSGETYTIDKNYLYEQHYGIEGNDEIKLNGDTYHIDAVLPANEKDIALGTGLIAMFGSAVYALTKEQERRRIIKEQKERERRAYRKQVARQRAKRRLNY